MSNNKNAEEVFNFLRHLTTHNNREWFADHRNEYLAAKDAFEQMVQQAILHISTFDESIKHLQPKDCVYRIYRDVRFSADKSPYKNHMGAYINARGKKSLHGGYYLHLQPDGSMLAGGSYCLPPKLMQQIRQSIVDAPDEYRRIVDAPEFIKYFPLIGEDRLKGAPKGFKNDNPYLKYIQPKCYDVVCPVADSLFLQSDWLARMEEVFRPMKPFLDFINYTIDDYEA